ncbi:SDR family oxidoreductase [Neobacillus niacini]|uniref:SDR family oxidoreductase n=1 Tax=Neobacillus niacini TaxID=86668 RepID=UPI0030032959
MKKLAGKRALVTASSSGIGKAIAHQFASEGATVFLSGVQEKKLSQTAREIQSETQAVIYFQASDFTFSDSIDALVNAAMEKMGGVDILVSNTGGPKPGPFIELTQSDWDMAYRLIMESAIKMTRTVLPRMIEQKWGRLIYITSSSIIRPLPDLHLSNVMRAGVKALSDSLAKEVAPFGVTTNVIAPAHIKTNRTKQIAENRANQLGISVSKVIEDDLKGLPIGRYGEPEEIASLVTFLASEQSSFITGQSHIIDGGFTKVGPF